MLSQRVEQGVNKQRARIRRRANPRFAYEVNGKPVPKEQGKAVVLDACKMLDERRLRARIARLETRHGHSPERLSVEKAMLAVEERIVKAYWVLARLPNDKGLGYARRNGIDYLNERSDVDARYSDAAGQKWESVAPRPPIPSGKDIDAMYEPFEWIRWLNDDEARILAAGAIWKRGDPGRNVNWVRVRGSRRELANFTTQMLKLKYRSALRAIVGEMTLRRISA